MTAQEQAKRMFSMHSLSILSEIGHKLPMDEVKVIAKATALLEVNGILPIVEGYEEALSASQQSDRLDYYKEVKQELEKL